MSKFEELLSQLDTIGKPLIKSQQTEKEPEEEPEEELPDAALTKSFVVTDADGTEHEAIDATDLLKSLNTEMGLLKVQTGAQEETLQKSIDTLAEAIVGKLGAIVDAQAAQDKLLKSLSEQVETIQGSGRGRKSTLTIVDKPDASTLQKSEQAPAMDADEFMAKAMTAQKEGRISGIDVCAAENFINNGMEVPKEIVKRVLAL